MMISNSHSLENNKPKTELPVTSNTFNTFSPQKILEASTTIFLSGLFDRSFFITAFMAIKYSKCLVMVSASFALSIIAVLSVFLGVAITKYIPGIWIEIFAVALFMFFGMKMWFEGWNMEKNPDLKNLEKGIEEETENLVKNENIIQHGHGLLEIQQDCELITNDTQKTSTLKIFFKIFLLIFASEIGDRSQISTIYLINNFDKMVVLVASILAQIVLTILAIFGGVLISTKISERNLTLIAGSTFILFGIVALFLLIKDDLLKVGTIEDLNTDVNSSFIPDRKVIY